MCEICFDPSFNINNERTVTGSIKKIVSKYDITEWSENTREPLFRGLNAIPTVIMKRLVVGLLSKA